MAKDKHANELIVGDIVTRIGDDGKPVEGMVNWIGTSGAEVNIKVGIGDGEVNGNSSEWEILKAEVGRQLHGPHNAAWRKQRAKDEAAAKGKSAAPTA